MKRRARWEASFVDEALSKPIGVGFLLAAGGLREGIREPGSSSLRAVGDRDSWCQKRGAECLYTINRHDRRGPEDCQNRKKATITALRNPTTSTKDFRSQSRCAKGGLSASPAGCWRQEWHDATAISSPPSVAVFHSGCGSAVDAWVAARPLGFKNAVG